MADPDKGTPAGEIETNGAATQEGHKITTNPNKKRHQHNNPGLKMFSTQSQKGKGHRWSPG